MSKNCYRFSKSFVKKALSENSLSYATKLRKSAISSTTFNTNRSSLILLRKRSSVFVSCSNFSADTILRRSNNSMQPPLPPIDKTLVIEPLLNLFPIEYYHNQPFLSSLRWEIPCDRHWLIESRSLYTLELLKARSCESLQWAERLRLRLWLLIKVRFWNHIVLHRESLTGQELGDRHRCSWWIYCRQLSSVENLHCRSSCFVVAQLCRFIRARGKEAFMVSLRLFTPCFKLEFRGSPSFHESNIPNEVRFFLRRFTETASVASLEMVSECFITLIKLTKAAAATFTELIFKLLYRRWRI